MEKVVITIARQYGSGGKTIGAMLAEKLGIEYYDKDLIRMASEASGINVGLFAEADEVPKGGLHRLFKKKTGDEPVAPGDSDFTSKDNLFQLQSKAIRDIADKESCVIIGRCADYVLRDYDRVLSVFVHAPMDFCIEQAMKKHSMSPKEMQHFIQKTDRARAEYYRYYTGREWTDARNYDLCLDSSKLGFERCVEEIIAYMNVRFKEV